MFEIAVQSDIQSHKQSERWAPKTLSFYDQSAKSPDSGLQADNM